MANHLEELRKKIVAAKAFFSERKTAYLRVFNPDPGSAHADSVEIVLKDLAKYCRANTSCMHADPRIHAQAEGRREVWLRIMEHLKLTPDEYWEKYGRE